MNRQSQRKKQIPYGNDKQKKQAPAPSGRQEPHPSHETRARWMGHPKDNDGDSGYARMTTRGGNGWR